MSAYREFDGGRDVRRPELEFRPACRRSCIRMAQAWIWSRKCALGTSEAPEGPLELLPGPSPLVAAWHLSSRSALVPSSSSKPFYSSAQG